MWTKNDYYTDFYKKKIEGQPTLFEPPHSIFKANETKSEAHRQLNTEEQLIKVYRAFLSLGGEATYNEVARLLNIPASTVSARGDTLKKIGKLVPSMEDNKPLRRMDDLSKKRNQLWRIK